MTEPLQLQRGQRAAAIMAAEFRSDPDGKKVLSTAWVEEDPRGVLVGFYELARLALWWLGEILGTSPEIIQRRVLAILRETARLNAADDGLVRQGTHRPGWAAADYAAAEIALDVLVIDSHRIEGGRNLDEGFADPRAAARAYELIGWGLTHEIADEWNVHPEEACRRFALQLAGEVEGTQPPGN